MTGDAPQPGETPRTESGSSALDAPAPLWPVTEDAGRPRHPRRRPPLGTAEAEDGAESEEYADAYAAGIRDAAQEFQERDHDQIDAFRYEPLPEPAPAPEPVIVPEPELDLMILPEPPAELDKSPEKSPVPGQARPQLQEPLPRATGDPGTDARLDRVENSPFWLEDHERPADLPLPEPPAHLAGPRRRRRHAERRPGPALFALVVLALVATFFAWVSAEPFWLAIGHGENGRAVTIACTGSGVTQRCVGRFTADDGEFAKSRVTLLDVADGRRAPGAVSGARMVSRDSKQAYLDGTGTLLQLRWMLGFLLVLACGWAIATLTGARRLDEPGARRTVLLLSLTGPLVLLAGFLVTSY